MLRASLLFLAVLILLPATASAASGSGGALAGPIARSFTATPASVAPGATVTFAYQATRGARVRVDLLRAGKAPTRVRLGIVASRGTVRADWTRRARRRASTPRGWSSPAPA